MSLYRVTALNLTKAGIDLALVDDPSLHRGFYSS